MNLRLIPTSVHGVLDYLASGINLAFPGLLGLHDFPVGRARPPYRRSGGGRLQPDHRLRTRRVEGAVHACAPGIRCRKGGLYGLVAVALRVRQERQPLLDAARADGHGGRPGSSNEQDRLEGLAQKR